MVDGRTVLTVEWAAPSSDSLERFEQFHVADSAPGVSGIGGDALTAWASGGAAFSTSPDRSGR